MKQALAAMFVNFRRIRKCQFVQLLTTGLVMCVVMVCWEELDHHVVSHVKSFTYRYLVNSYDFLNSSFAITPHHGHRMGDYNSQNDGQVNYPYLINHPGKCEVDGGGKSDVLLLLFVKTSPGNFERRKAIRETWGNESFVWSELGENMRTLFALGVHSNAKQRLKVQKELQEEDRTYGDLIQQDFLDTFYNLTSKLILQFHWSQEFCPQARFLMSADDDIFIHIPNLVKYLHQLLSTESGAKDLWVGHVHRGSPPVRRKTSKYHVPYELYPWPSYPDYTAGGGYVVSSDVASKIYHATQLLNSSMYIDDVFMGICAKAMGISPQEHRYFSGEAKAPSHSCIYDHMITSHGHTTDLRSMWQESTDPAEYGYSRGLMGNLYCAAMRVALLCLPYYHNTYSCFAAFT